MQRRYDHRLVGLVRRTRDPAIATRLGVPRSTAAGWTRRPAAPVVTASPCDATGDELRARIVLLEARVRRLTALLRLLLALFGVVRPDLRRLRVPDARDKARLLRAVERSRGLRGLRRVLRLTGLSPSRLAAWRRAARVCQLADVTSCPRSSPQRLTIDEVAAVRAIVTAPEYRHIPTGRLAVLAQRLGGVVASPTTLHRLVRERGWRRPRTREQSVSRDTAPTLLADAGVENRNRDVDALVAAGRLKRVLARTEISYSNSLIEAWWRSLKHQWLFLNPLDSVAAVERLVRFYVEEHNTRIPHAALGGRTPDETYFGTGEHVPVQLAAATAAARQRRLEIHRAARCNVCC